MRKELTEMQKAFIDALFSDECKGNVRKAMRKAGYSDETPQHDVLLPLVDVIQERTQTMIASLAPAAVMNMTGIINDPDALVSKTHFEALRDMLDRAGYAKKEKVEVSGNGGGGLFILPPKAKIEDE